MSVALKITVKGRVQGVGFRPFIFSLADEYRILGTVQNNMDGVKIFAESESLERLQAFCVAIQTKSPRLSKIAELKYFETGFIGYEDFTIIPSDDNGSSSLVIPIDAAVCSDCISEMRNPEDFRYNYPFINCTQCGPRYTIISNLPYDRPYTSMHGFQMCESCASEYNNPLNRRHHAQPIACPKCGPKLKLSKISGEPVETTDVLKEARALMNAGKIIAIKGIGGYHLCCDATNEEAVSTLRERKNRPNKPLAIMVASIEKAKKIAKLSDFEVEILTSPEAPIVLLEKGEGYCISKSVAPRIKKVGVMLPYTPMHNLLLDNEALPFIVATSANPSGLPMLYKDEEAFDYLADIADYVVSHNREILHPIDDSVVECFGSSLQLIRRARGFSPDPIIATNHVDGIVAFGGEMKNTFAIGRGEQIIIGPHIGEMENIEMGEHFKTELNHLLKWTTVPKNTAVVDLHPMFSTRAIAEDYRFEEVIEVQHHHAHMAGCMEENHLEETCYGIILDGTGYGLDGNIWGFEIFEGNKKDFTRIGHLKYSPLPGGDRAIKEPWRNAVGMLINHFGEDGIQLSKKLFSSKSEEINALAMMVKNGVNAPLAGTCGRLYDAVSSILGICTHSTYDGEAAIILSEVAEQTDESYSFEWHDEVLSMGKMLTEIVSDSASIELKAGKFQMTIVNALVSKFENLEKRNVVLSGGSFHNRFLQEEISKKLRQHGFNVFTHKNVPTGDGGLSYGQLAYAAARNSED